MKILYMIAFTFFLYSDPADPDAPLIPVETERQAAFHDSRGLRPARNMEECNEVAVDQKRRFLDAIVQSENALFAPQVDAQCFEYVLPKRKGGHHEK